MALQARWAQVADRLGATPDGADDILRAVVARYGEPHRRYHTLEHVAEVLEGIDRLIEAGEPAEDPLAVELAVWFHDAVHDATADDNEERSAALAVELLSGAGLASERVDRVADLVMATKSHLPSSPDAALLVDADLAILGADPERYDRYAADVRAEYAHVDDARWAEGRRDVLTRFLERPLLYHTGTMRRERGAMAIANLQREIAALEVSRGS
ncbi:hypothetical protein ER308_05155 [Egibacter rhizosphaerae]|uniref:Metal-dependent phosphohydrolase n=1 Tax=Egibacter rhizosphaerae TaxID=1670831 RepID=A0A411YL22_9ACTN|nr:hypothetical protein ER308_05155 [Egibacter rhizosphaerae]